MMGMEGFTKIVNFIILKAGVLVLGCGHISQTVKMHYFSKTFLLFSQAKIRQTKYSEIMIKEWSTKIVNFMTPWAEVVVLALGHLVKMHNFFNTIHLYC